MQEKNTALINFNNTEIAFRSKSNSDLREMLLLFKVIKNL